MKEVMRRYLNTDPTKEETAENLNAEKSDPVIIKYEQDRDDQ